MVSRHGIAVAAAISTLIGLAILLGFVFSGWVSGATTLERNVAPERELFLQSNLLPAVYLNYDNPTSELKQTWFSTVKVHNSADSTFFAVQRTQFGYLGLQQDSTYLGGLQHALGLHFNSDIVSEFTGVVIFSIWDNADCTGFTCSYHERCRVVEVGDGAYDNSFGGEGTGCQIKYQTTWGKIPYCFISIVEDVGNDWLKFTSYWHDASDDSPWKLMGAIKVKKNGRNLGEGGISSFIEQYRSIDSHEIRLAEFGPQFLETVSGEWVPITAATFRATDSNIQSYHVAAVVDGGSKFDLGVAGTAAESSYTPSNIYLRLSSIPQTSQVPQLQSWLQLRRSGNLPQGCAGSSCSLWQAMSQFFNSIGDWIVPSTPDQALMLVCILGFLAASAWVLCQCCKAVDSSGSSGSMQSSYRSLLGFG